MAFDTISNSLIVADAYYGIWSVDLTSLKKTQLVSADEILEGKVMHWISLHARFFFNVILLFYLRFIAKLRSSIPLPLLRTVTSTGPILRQISI